MADNAVATTNAVPTTPAMRLSARSSRMGIDASSATTYNAVPASASNAPIRAARPLPAAPLRANPSMPTNTSAWSTAKINETGTSASADHG